MSLRALIFDVDGTLAETEEVHRRAYNEAFVEDGLDWHWSRDDYAWLLLTTGGKERLRRYRDEIGAAAPTDAEIVRLYATKTARYGALVESGGLVLRPGVRDLVRKAQTSGLRLAVATTTQHANVDALCRSCWGQPASDMFEVVAAGDDVPVKKPAPDIYRLVLDRLGLPAEEVLVIEDSRNGLLSATGAGLNVIVTPSEYTQGEDFTEAARVLRDLTAFALPDTAD